MGDLDVNFGALGDTTDSIENTCVTNVVNDEMTYDFEITYIAPFAFDSDCLS